MRGRLLLRLLLLHAAGVSWRAAVLAAGDAADVGGGSSSLSRFSRGVDLSAPRRPDTLGALDDWKLFEPGDLLGRVFRHVSFLFILGVIGLGAWARARGAVARAHADGLRRICFMWLLPAFLLRHIWLCQLDSQLYAVGAWSLAFHGLWFALSMQAARKLEPHDRQMRGWMMLMSQGAMNSFLYPLLLSNDKFGEKALACAVLWDLGGNMWICQFALFAIAAFFKPNALGDEQGVALDGEHSEEEGETLLPKSDKAEPVAQAGVLQTLAEGIPREIVVDALRQPVLLCCCAGFLLNFAGVPLPGIADTPLWVVGEPYKLALYFLVGYYGDHNLGANDANRLARALGIRYAISATIIAIVVAVLPFEQMYRHTVALALLSPTSSYLIFLVGEHGYGESLLRLTVCGGFISVIISTVAQNVFIGIVSGGT